MPERPRRKTGCAAALVGVLIVALVLALGGLAVQRQVISPPETDICLIDRCLSAHVVRIPGCPPLFPCQIVPGIIPPQDRYVVALIDRDGKNAHVLLMLRIRR